MSAELQLPNFDSMKLALDKLKDAFLLGEWNRLPELLSELATAVGFKIGMEPKIVEDPDTDRIRRAIGDLMRSLNDLRYKPPELWPATLNGRMLRAAGELADAMEAPVDRP